MKKIMLTACLVALLASASFAPYNKEYEQKKSYADSTALKTKIAAASYYEIVAAPKGAVFLLDTKVGRSWKLSSKADGRLFWEQIYFENNIGDLTPEYSRVVVE